VAPLDVLQKTVVKQRPPCPGRNGGQIEKMVETEKELYKEAKPRDEVWISMEPLRGVCPMEGELDVSGSSRSFKNVQVCSMCYVKRISVL
jgi:hypothetical protein